MSCPTTREAIAPGLIACKPQLHSGLAHVSIIVSCILDAHHKPPYLRIEADHFFSMALIKLEFQCKVGNSSHCVL